MNALFGIPMDSLMRVMLVMFLTITAVVAVLALRNPLLFKLGARNLPRRRAQTMLIVFGLMLSTLIITSAFGTGDTLSYTIRSAFVNGLGAIDETVSAHVQSGKTNAFAFAGPTNQFMPASVVSQISGGVDPKTVDGVVGIVQVSAPIVDLTSRESKSTTLATGVPANYPAALGALTTVQGTTVTLAQLGPGQVYLGKTAAGKLNARAGDTLLVYVHSTPVRVTVRAVLAESNLAGYSDVLLPLPALQSLLRVQSQINEVLISNTGDNIGGALLTDTVDARLRILLSNPSGVAAAQSLLLTPQGQTDIRTQLADPQVAQCHPGKAAARPAGAVAATRSQHQTDRSADGYYGNQPTPRSAVPVLRRRALAGAQSSDAVRRANAQTGWADQRRPGWLHRHHRLHHLRPFLHRLGHHPDLPDLRDAGGGAPRRDGHGPGNRYQATAPYPAVHLRGVPL